MSGGSAPDNNTPNNAIILAAGKGTRWKGHPIKQLLPISGEPLICRTIRQITARNHTPWVVARHQEIINAVDCPVFIASKYHATCKTLLSTRELWSDQTSILLGDTIYSSTAISRILNCTSPIMFFGDRWEIYGLSFNESSWFDVEYYAQVAISHRAGRLRYLYRAISGIDLDKEESEEQLRASPIFHYMSWTDWTTDIDKPDQYELFIQNVIKKGRLDDRP